MRLNSFIGSKGKSPPGLIIAGIYNAEVQNCLFKAGRNKIQLYGLPVHPFFKFRAFQAAHVNIQFMIRFLQPDYQF